MAKLRVPPGVGERKDESGGTPTTAEKEILSKLFFDEKEFLDRLKETVGRATRFFQIEPHTGRVVLTDEARRRRVSDQIRLLLAGHYFVGRYGIAQSDQMSYRGIAVELNRPASGVSTELTDLVRDGFVARDEEGLYSMPFHRIDVTLRELEQSAPATSDPAGTGEAPRRASTRRAPRPRDDPVLKSMLEKAVDLSRYAWVRNLETARDKGLAGLLIGKDEYGVEEMTCAQLQIFLTRKFPVQVSRVAINMAFLLVKSQYVAPAMRGNEIAYSLLPMGREYILGTASELTRVEEPSDTSESAAV